MMYLGKDPVAIAKETGAQFVKGTYSVPLSGTAKIDFGKTFSKYLFFIEMTNESKQLLLNSEEIGNRTFACIGCYPMPSVDNTAPMFSELTYRVNPSTQAQTVNSVNSLITDIDASSITFVSAGFNGGANYLYRGQSYNYYIIEIK